MNLLIVNPNTTASMTRAIESTATSVAAPATVITATQPASGPASIEGYYDEAFSVPGLIDEIRAHPAADAVIIACFDDTGLDAARCITPAPVVGIGEAAFHLASLVCNKFGVVTTLSRSIAALEHNLQKYGLAARCAGVRASEVPVLELENPQSNARADISAEIARAIEHDRADAIVLGCAGMTELAKLLQAEHGVPVIDGVVSAVKLAEALTALGYQTSKTAAYAPPREKQYTGAMAKYAPTNSAR